MRCKTKLCLDKKMCSFRHNGGNVFLLIEKGARLLSNARHLRRPRGVDAVLYTARQDLTLLLPDRGDPAPDKAFLVDLAARPRLTSAQQRRAAAVCKRVGADGWYVAEARGRAEALVLVKPKAVLE